MNSQKIAVFASPVVPFRAIAEDADFVVIQPGAFGPPPSFTVQFGKYTPETPAVAAVPEIPQKSGPNRPDYVPARPAIPETPAIPASFKPHRTEQITLTQEEWDGWDKSTSDADYLLGLVAKRFGQTLVVS